MTTHHTPEFCKGWMAHMAATSGYEVANLIKCLDEFPESELFSFRPSEKSMTGAEQFWNIYGGSAMFCAGIVAGEFDPANMPRESMPATKADLKGKLEAGFKEMIERVTALSGEQLAKVIPFFNFGSYPAAEYWSWSLDHLIHHRGEITTYLRLAGGKVPDIYGGSLDHPFKM